MYNSRIDKLDYRPYLHIIKYYSITLTGLQKSEPKYQESRLHYTPVYHLSILQNSSSHRV